MRARDLAIVVCLLGAGQLPAADTPDAFERLTKEAASARAGNHAEDAIRLYRQALTIRATWPEGWWFLGELLYDQDQYPEARDALRRLVALDPKTGPGFALLGLCEYQTREFERALADINQGRRLGLGDDNQVKRVVLFHAMVLFTRAGMYESALELLSQIINLGGSGTTVIDAAGLAGLRRPILPEDLNADEKDLIEQAGKAVYAHANHRPDEAQKYFMELVAKYPKAPNVHYLYGSFLLGGDAQAGLRELEKELELNPKHGEALVQIALEYVQIGEPDKALTYAKRAVEAAPQFFAAHAVLGRLLAKSGDVDKAIQELELARSQAPDSPQVHFVLASVYAMAGRDDDAARERAEFVRLKKLADDTMGNNANSR